MPDGISVILPAYRERKNIESLVPALLASGEVEECIVVEDPGGENEGPFPFEAPSARLRLHRNPVRIGLAASIAVGIRLATSSHCLIRDSDWNHDIRQLPEFHALLDQDLVVASRYLSGPPQAGRMNDLFSRLLNSAIRLRHPQISDWTHGYFLARRELLLGLPVAEIFQGRGEYTIPLYRALLRRGIRVHEIPTTVQARGHGRSSTALLRHGWPYLRALLRSG